MCLAQGHNRVNPVRLEAATLRSGVKHSTTELPRKHVFSIRAENSIGPDQMASSEAS